MTAIEILNLFKLIKNFLFKNNDVDKFTKILQLSPQNAKSLDLYPHKYYVKTEDKYGEIIKLIFSYKTSEKFDLIQTQFIDNPFEYNGNKHPTDFAFNLPQTTHFYRIATKNILENKTTEDFLSQYKDRFRDYRNIKPIKIVNSEIMQISGLYGQFYDGTSFCIIPFRQFTSYTDYVFGGLYICGDIASFLFDYYRKICSQSYN